MRVKKSLFTFIYEEIKQAPHAFFLLSSLFIFMLLRIPSLVEPSWYGDEGIYQVIALALRHGRFLYRDIWDNKPPLLYLTYALFDGKLFYVRFLSLIVGTIAIAVFFLLAKKFFRSSRAVYASTLLYSILFGLPFIEGNIANSENFMQLPVLAGFVFLLSSKEKKKPLLAIAAGFLFSIAFLYKVVGLFDFAAALGVLFLLKYFDASFVRRGSLYVIMRESVKKVSSFMRAERAFVLSFAAPIILSILYFLLNGAFSDYYRAVFSQNVGYVGYGNRFLIPQGLLYIKAILLAVSLLLIFLYRKRFGRPFSIVLIWLSFSLFNALFSARPYTHYLLTLLPSLMLFIGFIFEEKRLMALKISVLVGILFLVSANFHFYGKTIPYYTNYLNFTFGKKKVEAYQAFFDQNTPRDYDVARLLLMNTHQKDSIFLWGDSAQIYYLANKLPPGRYIVAYHIRFYKTGIEETKRAIEKVQPKYIVATRDIGVAAPFFMRYQLKYRISDAELYERKF